MKKLISLALALVMILSLATVAFATEAENETPSTETKYEAQTFNPTSETDITFTLKKLYTLTGGDAFPAETLSFTSTKGKNNPDDKDLTIADLTVFGATNQTITITITLPKYDGVGKWTYTIKETAGNTQGVTYSEEEIGIEVLVTYDKDGKLTGQIGVTGSTKNDTFTNEYRMGTLTVEKTIDGNLASATQYFDIDVTFTATKDIKSDITVSGGSNSSNVNTIAADDWSDGSVTKTFKLKATDKLTFSNIPDGVTYTVTEAAKHAETDANGSDVTKGYTVTYKVNDANTDEDGKADASGTISTTESKVVVNNYKDSGTPGTGIVLDSMPYIILLTLAAAGMFVLLTKKRAREF